MSSAKYFLGVDPGQHGGMALIGQDESPLTAVYFTHMPSTEAAVLAWLEDKTQFLNSGLRCVIEQVSGNVGKQQPGSSMFNFGMSYGALRMALAALELRENHEYHAVHPRTWQSKFDLPKTPKTIPVANRQAFHKQRLRELAATLFPRLVVTAATADALLLAHYAKHFVTWEYSWSRLHY